MSSDFSSYEDDPKIYILKETILSDAFNSLSRVSLLVYIRFLTKRIMKKSGKARSKDRKNSKNKWECENNGEIYFPYSEAVQCGISRKLFRNAIDELQIKGFIDITHRGQGGRAPKDGTGDSTLYRLDDRWQDFDAEAGVSRIPPRKPRKKDARMNRGFQKMWADKNRS